MDNEINGIGSPPNDDEVWIPEQQNIGKFRRWFRAAVDHMHDWREEAQEDYDFVAGQQWTEDEKKTFEKAGRPAITVNRIKPLINVLSGYQRLNRYDIEFLPRTGDDMDLCQVRKGLTKYILDRCGYDSVESNVFLDAAIGGLGWFEVGYKHDPEINDGEAYVKRVDPFGIYIDPEAHEQDFHDAKFICRGKWVSKDELKEVYPEHSDEIDAQFALYDPVEREENSRVEIDPLWYNSELKKVRLVECWYKERGRKLLYQLVDGSMVPEDEMSMDMFLAGQVAVGMDGMPVTQEIPKTDVRVCVFFDKVLLEDIDSPYEHGDFPFVPLVCYHFGAGDIPAGFVRDLKDPQREINRRRIQELHILNTSGNGGGWIEDGAMTPEQEEEFKRMNSIPGHYNKVKTGSLSQGKILERQPSAPPTAIINAEAQATNDLTAISGINEALMGVDIPNQSSGRAIELKQKQAITHIAPMFDNLRKSKKQIVYLLWGKRGKPGVVPQSYTADKVYRVEGENGQQFIRVNQQVVQQDPMGNVIYRTLNDLSQGEFDVVIADVEASATQRQAQLWSLVDAVSKLQIPGEMVFDTIIDLADIPNKQVLKAKWQQMQQAQQQQAQQQMELEKIKNENINQSIAFRDAPLPIQFAMAAKQGLIDPQIAEYAVNLMVQQMFPQLAESMAQQRAQQAQQQQIVQAQQMIQQQQGQQQAQMPMIPQQGQQPQPQTMTKAAAQSVMDGMTPAM